MTYYGARIAEEIPEDRYDFRPTQDSRSVREILVHMLVSSRSGYLGHAVRKVTTFVGIDFPTLIRERLEQEKQLSTASKARIIDELRADGENWGTYLDAVKEDEMHHRAQLMVLERLLGLVPHLTRDRQARMAPPPPRTH